jgi:hypothetical protein
MPNIKPNSSINRFENRPITITVVKIKDWAKDGVLVLKKGLKKSLIKKKQCLFRAFVRQGKGLKP